MGLNKEELQSGKSEEEILKEKIKSLEAMASQGIVTIYSSSDEGLDIKNERKILSLFSFEIDADGDMIAEMMLSPSVKTNETDIYLDMYEAFLEGNNLPLVDEDSDFYDLIVHHDTSQAVGYIAITSLTSSPDNQISDDISYLVVTQSEEYFPLLAKALTGVLDSRPSSLGNSGYQQ